MLRIKIPIICPNPKCKKINDVREIILTKENEKRAVKNWKCRHCKQK